MRQRQPPVADDLLNRPGGTRAPNSRRWGESKRERQARVSIEQGFESELRGTSRDLVCADSAIGQCIRWRPFVISSDLFILRFPSARCLE